MRTPADVSPLVVPCNEEGTAWEGFLTLASAGSQRTALWLRLSHLGAATRSLKDAQLECSPELLDLLEVKALACPYGHEACPHITLALCAIALEGRAVQCLSHNQGFEDVVEARLGDSPDVATFFLELHTLLERLLRHRCPIMQCMHEVEACATVCMWLTYSYLWPSAMSPERMSSRIW